MNASKSADCYDLVLRPFKKVYLCNVKVRPLYIFTETATKALTKCMKGQSVGQQCYGAVPLHGRPQPRSVRLGTAWP